MPLLVRRYNINSILVEHYKCTFVLTIKGARGYRFGGGKGGIILSRVRCEGTEATLFNCSHDGFGLHTCDHSRDAGVDCLGNYG